jgi:DNA-binding MarR family transcriptional regulator
MTRLPSRGRDGRAGDPPTVLRRLAWFRYELRRFLRFSERAARSRGLTPLQHQLLLGVAGFTGRGWATVTELADFLQARHNAVVTLVQRAEARGWVRKDPGKGDRRFVRVRLTPPGDALLRRLARLHLDEIRRIQTDLHSLSRVRPRTLARVRPRTLADG